MLFSIMGKSDGSAANLIMILVVVTDFLSFVFLFICFFKSILDFKSNVLCLV